MWKWVLWRMLDTAQAKIVPTWLFDIFGQRRLGTKFEFKFLIFRKTLAISNQKPVGNWHGTWLGPLFRHGKMTFFSFFYRKLTNSVHHKFHQVLPLEKYTVKHLIRTRSHLIRCSGILHKLCKNWSHFPPTCQSRRRRPNKEPYIMTSRESQRIEYVSVLFQFIQIKVGLYSEISFRKFSTSFISRNMAFYLFNLATSSFQSSNAFFSSSASLSRPLKETFQVVADTCSWSQIESAVGTENSLSRVIQMQNLTLQNCLLHTLRNTFLI